MTPVLHRDLPCPPSTAGRSQATYAALDTLPDEVVGEIVEGELRARPRPRIRHRHAAVKLTFDVEGPFGRGLGGPGGWIFLSEPELTSAPT